MAKWSKKDERKYEKIKESAEKRGKGTKRAKEIASRTVNKGRARKEEHLIKLLKVPGIQIKVLKADLKMNFIMRQRSLILKDALK